MGQSMSSAFEFANKTVSHDAHDEEMSAGGSLPFVLLEIIFMYADEPRMLNLLLRASKVSRCHWHPASPLRRRVSACASQSFKQATESDLVWSNLIQRRFRVFADGQEVSSPPFAALSLCCHDDVDLCSEQVNTYKEDGWDRQLTPRAYCKRILSGEAMVYVHAVHITLRESSFGEAVPGVAQYSRQLPYRGYTVYAYRQGGAAPLEDSMNYGTPKWTCPEGRLRGCLLSEIRNEMQRFPEPFTCLERGQLVEVQRKMGAGDPTYAWQWAMVKSVRSPNVATIVTMARVARGSPEGFSLERLRETQDPDSALGLYGGLRIMTAEWQSQWHQCTATADLDLHHVPAPDPANELYARTGYWGHPELANPAAREPVQPWRTSENLHRARQRWQQWFSQTLPPESLDLC